eukprot:TRINITY_DN13203_c0_g1_i1.p1 TRINITY_DN13203_c0_g1~~TRINITY_DN13203_c0_g1_i1.p1  ORF type:complete len:347 (+),score=82.51 TRINITY_DN13203_c0_g1_i1:21-1061(+)
MRCLPRGRILKVFVLVIALGSFYQVFSSINGISQSHVIPTAPQDAPVEMQEIYQSIQKNKTLSIMREKAMVFVRYWPDFLGDERYLCPQNKRELLVTCDRAYLPIAKALIFTPTGEEIVKFPPGPKRIPWILDCLESPQSQKKQMEKEFMDLFDYVTNYRHESDAVNPQYVSDVLDSMQWTSQDLLKKMMLEPVDLSKKDKKTPVFWLGSNCDAPSGRHYFVRELQKYIGVASFGRCLNNEIPPSEFTRSGNFNALPEIWASRFKFYIAFENSNCDEYITEKLWKVWPAGIVPIVDGPSEYPDYASPTNHSMIQADKFKSIEALGKYLKELNEDDEKYMKFLSYKT